MTYYVLLGISVVLALGGIGYSHETGETDIYGFGLLMGAAIGASTIGILTGLGG